MIYKISKNLENILFYPDFDVYIRFHNRALREKIMSPQQNSFVKQILLSILKFGWHYKKND